MDKRKDNLFHSLPIVIWEHRPIKNGYKYVAQKKTVFDLLTIWDISDENEMSEVAQVLRHLKTMCEMVEKDR